MAVPEPAPPRETLQVPRSKIVDAFHLQLLVAGGLAIYIGFAPGLSPMLLLVLALAAFNAYVLHRLRGPRPRAHRTG